MRRLGLLILLAAVAAGGVVYTVRQAKNTSPGAVTAILPRTTIALAYLPDFNRTRNEWHRTDIYQLYQEAAVQDFLKKPLSKVPQRDTAADIAGRLQKLDPEDAFLAVTSMENNEPHLVGGFRFHGSQSAAEEIIAQWRPKIVRDPSVRESVEYQQHTIEIVGAAPNQMATVYDRQWFFVSNDLSELKAILDRVDARNKDEASTLEKNDEFRKAMAHMPSSYALMVYLQPQGLSQEFASMRNTTGASSDQIDAFRQIRSLCAVTRFDNGKMRDVLFIGTSTAKSNEALNRKSLTLGTSETFLYVAMLLNPDRLATINQGTWFLGSWPQKIFDAANRAGITADDWKAAFEPESGTLADWPQNARWPSIIATLYVRDPARANKLVNGLLNAMDENGNWTKREKAGVAYFSLQTPAALLAITPTLGLSNRALLVGLDAASVESAVDRTAQPSLGLSSSATFKTASRSVPAPTDAFVYLDTGLLYSHLDSALRPMLLMSAAFMPAISDYVDVGRIPPPEVVIKHLSPIVCSQRFDGDGYVTESIGPVTLSEAAIGVGLPAILWGETRQR
jgi:hypothetical protein